MDEPVDLHTRETAAPRFPGPGAYGAPRAPAASCRARGLGTRGRGAAPARPARWQTGAAASLRSSALGSKSCSALTTRHVRFPVDFIFYSSFGFPAMLRGKRRERPRMPCLPALHAHQTLRCQSPRTLRAAWSSPREQSEHKGRSGLSICVWTAGGGTDPPSGLRHGVLAALRVPRCTRSSERSRDSGQPAPP